MRFDELELESVPPIDAAPAPPASARAATVAPANRVNRLLALLTDLSLFLAVALALTPLLPAGRDPFATGALAGFVLIVSYYYFVGTWLLWGKTVGGTIFDVRVIAHDGRQMPLKAASLRWTGVLLSLLTGGLGFALAVLPSRRSLPDLLSQTHCVGGR